MQKFLFIFSVIISLIQFSFAGDNDSELPEPFDSLNSVANPEMPKAQEPPTIQPEQCSKKRAQETNRLPPAKKQKTDTLETWIRNNFSEHGGMLKEFSELTLSKEHDKFQGVRKTVNEIIREMDEECHQNPILIAFMICLSELGIESSMVKKYIQVVRSGLRTTEELTSRMAGDMHFTVMNAENGGQLPCFFTHTFIGAMHAGLLDFIKKFSDDNDFNIFMGKYNCIENIIKTKKENKQDLHSFQALSLTAGQYYPDATKWVEDNIIDPRHKMAFFSLFDKKFERVLLIDMIVKSNPSLENNQSVTAVCLYLYMLGVSSDDIHSFILYLRKSIYTAPKFSHTRAHLYFKNLRTINFANEPQQYFRGEFSILLKELLIPLFKSLSGQEFPHQESIEKLYKKYKKTNPEIIAKIFSFPEGAIVENSAHIDNNILQYIESLDAESDEKEALKSIFLIKTGGRKLVDKIRELKKSINTHPLIAALSVYLGHFGVASEDIYFVVLKIREGKDKKSSFGKTTPGTMYKKYHNIASNKNEPYFRRPFFIFMKEIFEPLLHTYVGQEAIFSQNDYLERGYGVGQQSKAINLNYYNSYAEKARRLDGSLVDWIESNITKESDQLAFFAMMTTKMSSRNQEEKNFTIIIKEIPNVLIINPHLCAGVIFLKHFGVSSVDIFNFIKEIRGNRLNTSDFGPLKSQTIYTNFLRKTKKPSSYLNSKSFKDTLDKILLPLMQKLSIDRDTQFLDA